MEEQQWDNGHQDGQGGQEQHDHQEEQQHDHEQEAMDAIDEALSESEEPQEGEGSAEEHEEGEDGGLEEDAEIADEDPEDYYYGEEDEPLGLSFSDVFFISKFIRHLADHEKGEDGKSRLVRDEDGKAHFGRNYRVLAEIISSQGRYGRKVRQPMHVAEAFYMGDTILASLKFAANIIGADGRNSRALVEKQQALEDPSDITALAAIMSEHAAAMQKEAEESVNIAWEMGDEERRLTFQVLRVLNEQFPAVSREEHDAKQNELPEDEREGWAPFVPKRITKSTDGAELCQVVKESAEHLNKGEVGAFIEWFEEAESIWPINSEG